LPARASGFQLRETSAEALGLAYAGNGSRADTAATAFTNPAGLTRLTAPELEAGASAIFLGLHFKGQATVAGKLPLPGDNGGNAGNTVGVPNLYGALPLSDDLSLGLAITVPYGDQVEYTTSWYGRYLATKALALSYDINPSIAYRLAPGISLGLGFSAQYLKLDVSAAIPQFLILGAPTAPDAFNRYMGHDWAYGFNAGLLMDVGYGSRLGITYRSRTDHDTKGTLNFAGASPFLKLVNGAASAKVDLPDTAGASLTTDLSQDISLSGDVQYSHWSVLQQVRILSANAPIVNQENFRDSWMLALGGSYRLTDMWSVSSGFAFDQTPVTSRYRSVILPDTDHFILGLGTRYRATQNVSLDAAYAHVFTTNRPNMNSSINNTDSVTHAVVLQGSYGVDIDILALSARYTF
jgi:long-chain fatty acid transport protein